MYPGYGLLAGSAPEDVRSTRWVAPRGKVGANSCFQSGLLWKGLRCTLAGWSIINRDRVI
jgi:hypothetical protein